MQKKTPRASITLSVTIAILLTTFGILFISLSRIYMLDGWPRVGVIGFGMGCCLLAALLLLRYIVQPSNSTPVPKEV